MRAFSLLLGFFALFASAWFLHAVLVHRFWSSQTCENVAVVPSTLERSSTCVTHFTRYSNHRCVGEIVGDEPWKYRSCEYHNICYDGNSQGTLTYYAHPADDATSADLSCGSMAPYQPDHRVSVVEIPVNVVRSVTPATAFWPSSCRNFSTVTVLNNYFMPMVWSHLLMDNIFPIFRLLHMFGHHRKLVEPLFMSNPCKKNCKDCTFHRVHMSWMHTLTNGRFSVQRLQEKYAAATAQSPVCFNTLVVGLSLFSDHGEGLSEHGRALHRPDVALWGIGEHVSRFRKATMSRFGARNVLGARARDVILLRKGKSNYSGTRVNMTTVRTFLQLNLKNVSIKEVTLEEYSIKAQMELMAQSKVVISEHGSTAFAALWLGKDATLILLHESMNEKLDFYFWKNLNEIRVKYVFYNGTNKALQEIIQKTKSGLWHAS